MKKISYEQVSSDFLHINSCDCQHISDVSLGSFRPNGRIDYHILYVSKGCCYITENNSELKAEEGSIIIYPPNTPQSYKFLNDIYSVSYYIHFSGTGVDEILKKLHLDKKRVVNIGNSQTIERTFNKMIDEFHIKGIFYQELCSGYLMQILSLIGKKNSYSNQENILKYNDRINNICKFIHAEIQNTLSIKEYAEKCYLSECRFSHLFKETTGISPKQYIINAKINKAKNLLIDTDLSISQISELVGLKDQNYFSRIFKSNTNYTPTEFRECNTL